jgi:hypothetical protein
VSLRARSLRTLASASAVVALVGLSVLAGAVGPAAAAPPPTPVITSPADGGFWADNKPVTVAMGATALPTDYVLTVYATVGASTTVWCTRTSNSPTASCLGTPFAHRTDVTFTADADWQSLPSEPTPVSAPVAVTSLSYVALAVTTSPPVSGPATSGTFAGTGSPEATITIGLPGGNCSTSVDLLGSWSCLVPVLQDGFNRTNPQQVLLNGDSYTIGVNYDFYAGTPPQPTITYPAPGGLIEIDTTRADDISVAVTHAPKTGILYTDVYVDIGGGPILVCGASIGFSASNGSGCSGPPGFLIPAGTLVTVTARMEWYPAPGPTGPLSTSVTGTAWLYRTVEILVAPPTIASDRNLHFAGVGTADSPLELTDAGGATICSTTIRADQTWTCDVPGPIAAGASAITAYATTPEGWIDQSFPEVDFTSVSTPVPTVVQVPQVRTAKRNLDWALDLGGISEFHPGDEVTLTGSGLPTGAFASAELHSTPVSLGSAYAGGDGTFTINSTIPLDIEPGAHSFVVTVSADGANPSTVNAPIIVLPAAADAPATPEEEPGDEAKPDDQKPPSAPASATGDWTTADRNDPASESALTESIATFADLWANPVVVGVAAVVALVLLLFVAFPAELLNATIAEQYDRAAENRGRRTPGWWTAFRAGIDRLPVVSGTILILIAAVIFGFVDPRFGFDIVSLRVVLACAIATFILVLLASLIAGGISRRAWDITPSIELRPLGLVLAVVGVVASRLLDFLPGIMIGMLAGLVLLGSAPATARLRVTIVRAMVIWGIAVAAWFGYSLFVGGLAGSSFAGNLVIETLVAVTTEGLTALLVGMLPLRFLEGSIVFRASKRSWAVLYFTIALTWVVVVLPMNFVALRGPIWQWAIVAVAFALLAVGVSVGLAVRARNKRVAGRRPERARR